MRLWHRLKSRTGPWTLDSTLYMKNMKGRGDGWGVAVGRYRIYVFPLVSATVFLFLADFPFFSLLLYKHVTSKSSRLFCARTSSSLLSSTPLGTTDLREDLKISLEGLRWVEGLYGGFILLAPLSSLYIVYSSKCLFLSKNEEDRFTLRCRFRKR